MRNYLSIATVCVAVLGLGGAAWAGDAASTAADKARSAIDQGSDTVSQKFQSTSELAPLADRLVGKNVTNGSGDDVGEITDLAIGPDQNGYAIVAVGQFLGLGGKDIPVQLSELSMQGDNVVLMSQSTEEALKARPEYDPSMYQSYSKAKDATEDATGDITQ